MTFVQHRITIIQIRKPNKLNLNEELQWLGNSLGLFNERDRDKSCFRIFLELLKACKVHRLLSSDDIAEQLRLSRGTVVHHLHRLMEAGIVISEGKKYILRQEHLGELIEEVRKDILRTCEDMLKTAKEIDDVLKI